MEEEEDMDGFDELSDGDDETIVVPSAALEHDDSWKVRYAACKCLDAFVHALVRNANESKIRSGVYLRHASTAVRLLVSLLSVITQRLGHERQPTVLLGLLNALGIALDLREPNIPVNVVSLMTASLGVIERRKDGSSPLIVEAACGVLQRLCRSPDVSTTVADKLLSMFGETIIGTLKSDIATSHTSSQRAVLALLEALLTLFGERLLPQLSEACFAKLTSACTCGDELVATAAFGALRAATRLISTISCSLHLHRLLLLVSMQCDAHTVLSE
jgi:hypothetical protein